MKKAAIQIAVLAGILLAICVAARLAMHGAYVAHIPLYSSQIGPEPRSLQAVAEAPEIVAPGTPELVNGSLRVPIRPQKPGETFVVVADDAGAPVTSGFFRVGRFGTVYDVTTGGFTGDSVVLVAFTTFCLAVAAIMLRVYVQTRGPAFYSYSTIYAAGFSLFALLTGLTMLYATVRHLLHPADFLMLSAYSLIAGASGSFMMYTAPFVLLFAAAMAISNAALLRHERFRPQNVLGIGIAVLLVLGEALGFWLVSRNFAGSHWEYRLRETLENVYTTCFAYFECMLLGSIVCGLRAARHVPADGVDYILILGCRFRADGTLTPLLQGRVDRALEFWRAQKRRTGREAVLMPSGGQGPDEVMPEAEAMRRYLLEKGVPAAAIRTEDRSRNTYQNMEYSRALIEAEKPGARVAYATTNYHVFRSGVWAGLAGLPSEGMGSPTKWWYWPNAFMRECAGLILNRIPQELLLLAVMVAFFGALSVALG